MDRGELIERRDKKLKSLYKWIQCKYYGFYRCLVCKPEVDCVLMEEGDQKYLIHMESHIIKEHMDKLKEVDSEMRREVLARKIANHGVEDPVRWEEYYRTNCKLTRPI